MSEQVYYGTKRVTAWPEVRRVQTAEEKAHGGTGIGEPADGYGVRYEDGYTSWSPKEAFEAAYMPVTAMDFGRALQALRDGHRIARAGWNGKGMFIFIVPGSIFGVNRPPLLGIFPEGTRIEYHPHIDMKTAQGYIVPWVASQADLFGKDWLIVE